MKKKSLTLLEVVIATMLAALVLGALFHFYRQISIASIEARKIEERLFSLTLMQERLGQAFAEIPKGRIKDQLPFYTQPVQGAVGPALLFKYHNGVDPDPAFCGLIEGTLYLQEGGRLCLESRSAQGTPRKEILLERIEKMQLRFFNLSEKCFKEEWSQEDSAPPALIELSLFFSSTKKPWQCVFFTPAHNHQISYLPPGPPP